MTKALNSVALIQVEALSSDCEETRFAATFFKKIQKKKTLHFVYQIKSLVSSIP